MSTRGGGQNTARSRTGGGGGSPVAALHERSARLQREGGLKAEAKPGEKLTPVRKIEGREFDISAHPDAHFLAQLYGEHVLGAALARYPHSALREAAAGAGVKPGASKAETVSRLTAHVTEGRYSANFGASKPATASARTPSPGARATAAVTRASRALPEATDAAHLRAALLEEAAARLEGDRAFAQAVRSRYEAGVRATPAKASATRANAEPGAPMVRPDSQLRQLDDPTSPNEAWARFGSSRDAFYRMLREEPLGVLEAMARHRTMPTGGRMPRLVQDQAVTRERLATFIADAMARAHGAA